MCARACWCGLGWVGAWKGGVEGGGGSTHLRQAGGTERMALRDEPARRVHDPLPAVRHVAAPHELVALPDRREPERLVRQQLVAREAVVELNDLPAVTLI